MSTTGVTAPQGFRAAGTTAGIKATAKPDMALVLNDGPRFDVAAVFTRNRVVAAPIVVTREAVADGHIKAVIYNSGNANACNGAVGVDDAREIQTRVAGNLGIQPSEVGVCSTGLIGDRLPMEIIRDGIDTVTSASNLGDHGEDAAHAIMTTDTVIKQTVVNREGWTLGGMGKGVGMMAPSLATMLVCLTSDADVDAQMLDTALRAATPVTFDTIDIDGSTSTNDTVILMASGASGIKPSQEELNIAVLEACRDLAEQLQSDAEGVTKRVSVTVQGTADDDQAREAARIICRDNLFKCAMFGSDPNWGRVLAAVGMAPVDMDPEHISVSFNGQPVCIDSTGASGAREVDLSGTDIDVVVDLGTPGLGRATVRTTDLSYSYVEINSAYSS